MSNLFSGFNSKVKGPGGTTGRSPAPTSVEEGSNLPSSNWPLVTQSTTAHTPLPRSSSQAQSIGSMSSSDDVLSSYHLPRPLPLWLNPAYARHIVKGNFMTLSARPKTVEQGEWIAHQVVEHYRNLWHFVRVIYEKEENGIPICNSSACPRMSAGANHSYTWLNSRYEPIELPAYEYITLMQRWISGKIDDNKIFPTDPAGVSFAPSANTGNAAPPLSQLTGAAGGPGSEDWVGRRSGFPREFMSICQTVFLQMFRVYAHLYHSHFVEPFYHLNLEKQLNSCFSHFLLTATALDLLRPHELEPMQPLIDLWAANGTFPPESKAYQLANVRAGQRLLQIGGVS